MAEFFMVTYGRFSIEEAYIGKTKTEAIQAAREMINKWAEYRDYSNEELLDLLHNEDLEFDLVKIASHWPGRDTPLAELVALYENKDVMTPISR